MLFAVYLIYGKDQFLTDADRFTADNASCTLVQRPERIFQKRRYDKYGFEIRVFYILQYVECIAVGHFHPETPIAVSSSPPE